MRLLALISICLSSCINGVVKYLRRSRPIILGEVGQLEKVFVLIPSTLMGSCQLQIHIVPRKYVIVPKFLTYTFLQVWSTTTWRCWSRPGTCGHAVLCPQQHPKDFIVSPRPSEAGSLKVAILTNCSMTF